MEGLILVTGNTRRRNLQTWLALWLKGISRLIIALKKSSNASFLIVNKCQVQKRGSSCVRKTAKFLVSYASDLHYQLLP